MDYTLYYRQVGISEDLDYNKHHSHDDAIEIIQILSGTGRILLGDRLGTFKPGDLYIIDSNVIHSTAPDLPESYERNKLLFNKMLLLRLLNQKVPASLTRYCSNTENQTLSELFTSVSEKLNADEPPLLILSDILQLLNFCFYNPDEHFVTSKSLSAEVMDYIGQNLSGELSLDSIAKVMHISKYYLCHCFKKETGLTLGTYIHTMRFLLAKQLLVSTNDTIASIAVRIGFNDTAAFSKAFIQENKMAPTAYRSIYRQ